MSSWDIAGKIGKGVRRVAKISGEALEKLKEREKRAEELERKKQKTGERIKPEEEETYAEWLGKVMGF